MFPFSAPADCSACPRAKNNIKVEVQCTKPLRQSNGSPDASSPAVRRHAINRAQPQGQGHLGDEAWGHGLFHFCLAPAPRHIDTAPDR